MKSPKDLKDLHNSTVLKSEVLVAASFYGASNVSTDRIHLFLDGVDITSRASVEPEMLSYAPAMMNPGTHTIRIMIRQDGGPPIEKKWSFTVAGAKSWSDELDWSGKVTSTYRLDKLDESELSVGTVGIFFRGSAYDWLRMRTNVKLATDEDPLIQPRNRYSFQLSLSRFLDLNFGDTNSRISRFTIDGKRVRGLEANLKLGVINLHYLQGDLVREVDGSLETDASYAVNRMNRQGDTTFVSLTRQGYTFQQNLTGGRLSFGGGKYFQMGFSFLKIKDNINTVSSILNEAKIHLEENLSVGFTGDNDYTLQDFLQLTQNDSGFVNVSLDDPTDWKGVAPQDNIVLGSDIGFYLDNKRILLEGEMAFSLYNKDIWDGALTLAGLDTLLDDSTDNSLAGSLNLDDIPIDPADLEDFFVIGIGMIPLSPIDMNAIGDSATVEIGDAILNMPSLSYRGRAKLQYFGNYLTVEYSRVGPQFKSLANPYLVSGINQFTISDRIQLLKNRILLTVEYRHQNDDVYTSIENITSDKRILTNLTIIPGPGLPTITFGYRQNDRDNGISEIESLENITNEDTTLYYKDEREYTKTQNITTSINYTFDAFDSRHSLFGTFVNYDKADQFNDRDLDSTFLDPGITSQVFSLTANSRFGFLPLKTTMNFTTNTSEFSIGPGLRSDQSFTSAKLDVEYGILNQKIILLSGVNYMSGEGVQDITRIGFKGGLRFKMIENLTANATANVRNKTTAGNTSSELIVLAGLSYVF